MKTEIRSSIIRALTLFLTAVCLFAGVPDASAQDANTIVYVDALWCRVHAADCPDLILKEHKPTMTLGEADQLGYRIGESGQSGRTDCCLNDYEREYYTARNVDAYYDTTYVNPGNSSITTVEGALIPYDAIGVVELMGDGDHKYHVYGCHRFTPDLQDQRMTLEDARSESGFYICQHCIERGPGFAQMSDEEWAKLPSGISWTPPAGWSPSSFSADTVPPQEEIDILLSQALHGAIGIQESVYTNPVATVENFMIMRFFFPVHRWLELYQAYRCTGDTNVLEQLRGSARHYNTLSKNYLSAAQKQAKDPEGMAYMYTMAASARITLQLARKFPAQVSAGELAEAEDFLMTIMSVLQPACEGNDNLDPSMGIPKPLADDFRDRAFNRALNGIGTIGMATAALEDLQTLNSTTAYQSTIDRYRKVIQEYIRNWKSEGFEETVDGKDYFSYPYSAGSVQWVGDVKLFAADDQGHFSHSMQGCYVLYDSVPELVDDAFMTAIANTIEFNSYTTSGSPQTPSQEAIRPYSRKSFSLPSDRLYLLNAFNDGVIDGQCSKKNAAQTESVNSEYEYRRATLNAQYLKALRQDRTLIHLADEEFAPPASPTGLSATAGDGEVTLDWDDNSESNLVGYNVYRATASSNYTTTLAVGLSTSDYVDTSVTNDTTYYYVVTAMGSSTNESAQSAEVFAMPVVLPVVSIVSPTNGVGYIAPVDVTVDVSASYSEGAITKVELWKNGALEGTDTVAPYSFSLAGLSGGTYTLEARAYHNEVSASDDVQIFVRQNEPPTVDAGITQTIEMPTDTVNLDATVTDDGLPEGASVTTMWSKVSGPGSVTFGDASSIDTTANFSAVGTYVLRLTADDTEFSTTNDVQIVVNAFNPTQTLTFEPVEDAYLEGGSRKNDSYLKVEPGYRIIYIKFDVSGVTGPVTDIKLSMKESGDVGNGTFRLYKGSHNNWTEDNLSTSIAPAEDGEVCSRTETVSNGETVVFDVDGLVSGDGEVSVIVKMDNGGNDVWFSSKEGSTPPVLEVTFDAGQTTNAAPTGLTAAAGDGSVILDWNDSMAGDLAGYNVYRSTVSGTNHILLASNLTSSAHMDNTAVNGITYYYLVTAVDSASQESAQSAEVSATPQADMTPPAAPIGLAATAGDRWVSLDWNDNGEDDLDSYSVYRSTTSGSYGAALATELQSSQYIDNSVDNGTTYYYVVTAFDTSTNQSPQSTEVSAMPQEVSGFSDVTVFGSDYDGYGEFTNSEPNAYGSWVELAESVQFTESNTPSDLDGSLNNNSLLKAFALDRSVGKSYTIKGTLTWSAEADRNNRQGIYLFGHNPDIAAIAGGEDATGELSLQYQADARLMRLQEGLDTTTIRSLSPSNAPAVNSYFAGLPFTFQADIAFINTNGIDQIDITCTMIDEFGGLPATNMLSAVVNAADYTGEYFGFAGRTRADGSTTPTDSIVQYETFSIIESGAPVLEGYEKWLSDNGVADTDANFYEYAMASDPSDGLAPTNRPTFSKVGNGFLYVHPQRSDDTNIIYTVETTTNLMDSGSWTNAGYVVIGTNVTGETLNFVTNDVDVVDSEKFIRLKVGR